jgi:hypothetical protein
VLLGRSGSEKTEYWAAAVQGQIQPAEGDVSSGCRRYKLGKRRKEKEPASRPLCKWAAREQADTTQCRRTRKRY